MKEIKFRFEDGRLIFQIGDEEYFLPAEGFLALLNRQAMHDTFESLKLENRFADLNRLEVAAKYQILKDRGVEDVKIAERLNTTLENMHEWISSGYVEEIKEKKKSDFEAVYRGFD